MKKVFIITGGNRGLGEAFISNLIIDKRFFVISISRSLSEEQKTYNSDNFYFLKADLSDEGVDKKLSVLKSIITSEAVYFISNASNIKPIISIGNIANEDVAKTISINIKSPIEITQYLLRHFNKNKLSFINISSGAANRAIDNWSLYCSSKAFMQMFYNVAESEYKQHRFFNIDPGVMETNMQKIIRASDFPDVSNFRNLKEEGKLKPPSEVAKSILNTVL
jgi:benzil reductase ((S)-benzoin forming)